MGAPGGVGAAGGGGGGGSCTKVTRLANDKRH